MGLAHQAAGLGAIVRLAGLVDAMAVDGEFPAMIAASDAVILDPPIIERRAAMHAARIKQAGAVLRRRETESGPRQARGSGAEFASRPRPTPRDASSAAAIRPSACRGRLGSASQEMSDWAVHKPSSDLVITPSVPETRALGVAFGYLNCRMTWHRSGKQFNMLSFLPQARPVLSVLNVLSIVPVAGRSA